MAEDTEAEVSQSHVDPPQSKPAMTPQQLVQRGICPVKREYVLTSVKRVLVEAVSSSAQEHKPVEKQSRKKQKREWQQVRNRASNAIVLPPPMHTGS